MLAKKQNKTKKLKQILEIIDDHYINQKGATIKATVEDTMPWLEKTD